MSKILKDSEGNLAKAIIINSVPRGFEDITALVVNPEKINEVEIQHLNIQTIAAVEEVQAQQAFWTDGTDTYYDADDIPTIEEDGVAVLDPSFIKTPAVEYVAPEPQKYRLVKKNGTDATIELAQKKAILKAARVFGDNLITEFGAENMVLGITQDGMTNKVRKAMSEITNALITGSLKDAIDEIDEISEADKDDKYITDERLAEFKAKILSFLGL